MGLFDDDALDSLSAEPEPEHFNPFTVPTPAEAKAAEPDPDALPPGARALHVTELDRFLECGHKHAMLTSRTWTESMDQPRLRGSAVHKARLVALKAWAREGKLPTDDVLEDAAATYVRSQLHADEANDPAVDALEAATIDEAVSFVRADRALLLESIAPHVLEVEQRLLVELAGEGIEPKTWFLSGTPDSIGRDPTTGKLVLPDLKTSSKAATQAALNTSAQLTGYAFLARQRYGEIPIMAHHSLRLLKRAPKPKEGLTFRPIVSPSGEKLMAVAERKATERSSADLDSFVLRLNVVTSALRAGIAMPASASTFMSPCHRCEFRGHKVASQRCPFVPAYRGFEGSGEESSDE